MSEKFTNLLTRIHESPNYISPSAYDTAWLAWFDPRARDWIINAQYPDGSWGAEVEYFHDRVISTLSALNAITATTTNGHDLHRVEQGIRYVEQAIPRLNEDIIETSSFELLLPSLVHIGLQLGLKFDRIQALLEPQIMPLYQQKLALAPKKVIYSPEIPFAHTLEFIGFDELDRTAVQQLRGKGGIHCSPAATAFAEIATHGSPEGRGYLEPLMERYGAVPTMAPLELFEIIWSLYHFSLVDDLSTLKPTLTPLLEALKQAWTSEGLGFTTCFVPDADSTALAFRVFEAVGVEVDPKVFETYEVNAHFQCYPRERNISLGVHVHMVEALKQAKEFPRRQEMLTKALKVLERYLTTQDFIVDKWHTSPYYSTSRAVHSLTGVADRIIARQIKWLLKTQRADGSWTFYPGCPKAAIEETAYALLAMMKVYETKGDIPFEVIDKGGRYLLAHYTSPEDLPGLWMVKGLYNPYHVVESVILAALAKYQQLVPKFTAVY